MGATVKVVVVGGGVVGLACAYFLHRRGADVIVVERQRCGEAASSGNAGWISRSISTPVAAPGVLGQALRWVTNPESPFFVRPRADVDFLRWTWGFARACSESRYNAAVRALVRLGAGTNELLDELATDGVSFEMHEAGLLFVATSQEALAEYAGLLTSVQAGGYDEPFSALDRKSALELEPALSDRVVGALYAPADRHVRPESLTRGLAGRLRNDGVQILEEQAGIALARDRARWRVEAPAGAITADVVVVAAGAWSPSLLTPLGVRVPIEAAKGYSLTAMNDGLSPRHPLYLTEAKVGCTPFSSELRFAGTLELTGLDITLTERRLLPLHRAAGTYLRDWRPRAAPTQWAGLRPLLPDTLPVIGPVPGRNGLYIATGHGHLGVTLAVRTGQALSELVLGDGAQPELEPFSLERMA